jgi:SPW repeat
LANSWIIEKRFIVLTRNHAARARTASATNILLGAWLLASPWVFGYQAAGAAATWNSVLVGALVAILAACNALAPHPRTGLYWINVLLALWTLISPLRYGYSENTVGFVDNLVLALLIAALAISGDAATTAAEESSPLTAATHRPGTGASRKGFTMREYRRPRSSVRQRHDS